MNWLSCYFNNLYKSDTALVLLGNKEVSKDIFWDKIIKEIFGAKYCITINHKQNKLNSLFDIAKEKLFFHIEDDNNSNKKVNDAAISRILKDLLLKTTASKLTRQNREEIINIHGQMLITADKIYPFIKNSLSKCTIVETNDITTIMNKLNVPDEITLEEKIEENLYDFAKVLLTFQYDKNYVNYPFYTDIRDKVKNKAISEDNSNQHINTFIQAIKEGDEIFFEKLKSLEDTIIYKHLVNAFEDGYFIGQDLYEYYNAIYPNEFSSKKQLMSKLKYKDDMFVQMTDTFRISKPDGSDKKTLFSTYQTNINKGSKKLYKIEGYKLPSDMIIKKGYVISSSQRHDKNIFDKYTYEDNKEDAIKLQDKYNNK